MKVFVFGAGASHSAAIRGREPRPPLVDELLEQRFETEASSVHAPTSDWEGYRAALAKGRGLEELLTTRWDEVSHMKDGFLVAHRRFFAELTFSLWRLFQRVSDQHAGPNGYDRFVRKLKDKQEDFGLINFNYDILLAYAVSIASRPSRLSSDMMST